MKENVTFQKTTDKEKRKFLYSDLEMKVRSDLEMKDRRRMVKSPALQKVHQTSRMVKGQVSQEKLNLTLPMGWKKKNNTIPVGWKKDQLLPMGWSLT